MNTIKVSVDYETPSSNKFEALMEEYFATKAIAENVEETMIPLIQVGGKAKYDVICRQLGVISEQLKQLASVSPSNCVKVGGRYDKCGRSRTITIEYNKIRDTIEIKYRGNFCGERNFLDWEQNQEELLSPTGLVTQWNNFKIIEEMQDECNRRLRILINHNQEKTQRIIGTLNAIRG